MSDIDSALAEAMAEHAEVSPEAGFSSESGQADVGAEVGSESTSAPEASAEDFFNISEYADKKVRVKVGGEEIAVPVSELAAGYQRQADYTRKTQEVAAQREQAAFGLQLQQALEINPAETIKLLSATYGVQLTPAQAQQIADDAAAGGADTFVDPVERLVAERLSPIEAYIQDLERERAVNQLERDLASLKTKYGDDFNEQAVVQAAVAMGETDLDKVFKIIAFDTLMAKQQAVTEYTSQQAAEDANRMQAKAAMADLVSGGASAASAVPTAHRTNSIEDAFMETLAELGVSL